MDLTVLKKTLDMPLSTSKETPRNLSRKMGLKNVSSRLIKILRHDDDLHQSSYPWIESGIGMGEITFQSR